MPRIRPSLLVRAHHVDPFLPLLLRSCRDLPSARNELRWIREHVKLHGAPLSLYRTCLERSRGKPLQYILGNQPFGELDILCEPGVLIPRHETEAYTIQLATLLLRNLATLPPTNLQTPTPRNLRILDLCTGTGCIPLLLHALLSPQIPHLSILAIDISPLAIALATKNLLWNIAQGHLQPSAKDQITFLKADILHPDFSIEVGQWDILVSNPPYISPQGFRDFTARSVKLFEPKSALVPPPPPLPLPLPLPLNVNNKAPLHDIPEHKHAHEHTHADTFYPPLLTIASKTSAKLLLLETDSTSQASRIATLAHKTQTWDGCEIWEDNPEGRGTPELGTRSRITSRSGSGSGEDDEVHIGIGIGIRSVGKGKDRAVVCWRGEGGRWLGRGRGQGQEDSF